MKLIRAQEHLKSIVETLRGFAYGQCEIIPEQDREHNLGLLRVRLPKTPPMLSVVIGDFLYDVRSALDHIVWQLVLTNAPNEPLNKRKNAFPICTTPENFAGAKQRGRLKGVPEKAAALIEKLQPYSGRDNPLGLLDDLHNVDKHRTLNVVTAVAKDTLIDWSRGDTTFLRMLLGDEELRDGAVLGDIGLKLDDPGIMARFNNVRVQGQAAIFVAFADAVAETLEDFRVDMTLERIFEFVRDTVFPTFESFFN